MDDRMFTALLIAGLAAIGSSFLFFGTGTVATVAGWVFIYLAVMFLISACAGINSRDHRGVICD